MRDEGAAAVDDGIFFFSSRRRHTRFDCDWSSDVCSSDLAAAHLERQDQALHVLRTPNGRGGGERDEDDVVAVLAEGAAFLLHDADDGEAVAVDLDGFADRVGAELELLGDGLPDDADALLALGI